MVMRMPLTRDENAPFVFKDATGVLYSVMSGAGLAEAGEAVGQIVAVLNNRHEIEERMKAANPAEHSPMMKVLEQVVECHLSGAATLPGHLIGEVMGVLGMKGTMHRTPAQNHNVALQRPLDAPPEVAVIVDTDPAPVPDLRPVPDGSGLPLAGEQAEGEETEEDFEGLEELEEVEEEGPPEAQSEPVLPYAEPDPDQEVVDLRDEVAAAFEMLGGLKMNLDKVLAKRATKNAP